MKIDQYFQPKTDTNALKYCYRYIFAAVICKELKGKRKSLVGAIGLLSILLFSHTSAVNATNTKAVKKFTEFCTNKANLPAPTKRTVDVLLQTSGTNNCTQAEKKLALLKELDLSEKEISDDNIVSDVKPLSTLTKLTVLNLIYNQVVDVKPLANLRNLEMLMLMKNRITDASPLCNLPKIEVLSLAENPLKKRCAERY